MKTAKELLNYLNNKPAEVRGHEIYIIEIIASLEERLDKLEGKDKEEFGGNDNASLFDGESQ